ncbi:MAG TPA: recombinase XerD, partial [Rhodospirillaceae bacterium]|nr:recombinase XerD [Rhodospirillaceae bacterium]
MSPRREPIEPVLVSRYFEAFVELLVAERGASANTVSAYGRDLEDAARFLGVTADSRMGVLDGASTDDLRGYLKHLESRGMSARTSARRLSTLRQFYRFLCADGLRADDPSAILESPRQGRPLPKILSEDDVNS